MARHHSVSFTPTLRVFISKVITPVVLIAGILILIVFNFKGVLKTVQTTDDRFQGLVSFSQGSLAYRFSETSGVDRPAVRFNNQALISYAEWSSTISIDGEVQELWNSGHGYSYDEKNRQMYNTINGPDWQIMELVTLVNDRTVKVTFNFAPKPTTTPTPVHYVFDIAHSHLWWYQYQLSSNNDTFTAQLNQTTNNAKAATVSLKVAGDAAQNPQIKVGSAKTVTGAQGTTTTTGAVTTEYVLDNPTPNQMVTLGTETITYNPGDSNPGSPSDSVVPLPKP